MIDLPTIAAPEPERPAPPISPEIAAWIDRWCEDEGIARRPWWRRLFG